MGLGKGASARASQRPLCGEGWPVRETPVGCLVCLSEGCSETRGRSNAPENVRSARRPTREARGLAVGWPPLWGLRRDTEAQLEAEAPARKLDGEQGEAVWAPTTLLASRLADKYAGGLLRPSGKARRAQAATQGGPRARDGA